MNKKAAAIFIFTIILAILSCSKTRDGAEQSQRISISGAWALYPMVVKWAEVYHKQNPDIIIDISAGGAGKGMADALSGAVDLGMVSRDINKAEMEKGAWWVSVVRDAVIPVINEKNPMRDILIKRGVKKDEFTKIWIEGKATAWNSIVQSDKIYDLHVYTRSDACGASETWARYAGGSQEDLKGIGIYGDPGLADAVKNDILGIGYNNVNFAYDAKTKKPIAGLLPLPMDINGNGKIDPNENFYSDRESLVNAISENRFPSPPARDLHLVAKGIPKKEQALRFLIWILNEGQDYARDAGYMPIPRERLKSYTAELTKALP